MCTNFKKWSKEEDALLLTRYGELSVVLDLKGRSENDVVSRMCEIGPFGTDNVDDVHAAMKVNYIDSKAKHTIELLEKGIDNGKGIKYLSFVLGIPVNDIYRWGRSNGKISTDIIRGINVEQVDHTLSVRDLYRYYTFKINKLDKLHLDKEASHWRYKMVNMLLNNVEDIDSYKGDGFYEFEQYNTRKHISSIDTDMYILSHFGIDSVNDIIDSMKNNGMYYSSVRTRLEWFNIAGIRDMFELFNIKEQSDSLHMSKIVNEYITDGNGSITAYAIPGIVDADVSTKDIGIFLDSDFIKKEKQFKLYY